MCPFIYAVKQLYPKLPVYSTVHCSYILLLPECAWISQSTAQMDSPLASKTNLNVTVKLHENKAFVAKTHWKFCGVLRKTNVEACKQTAIQKTTGIGTCIQCLTS